MDGRVRVGHRAQRSHRLLVAIVTMLIAQVVMVSAPASPVAAYNRFEVPPPCGRPATGVCVLEPIPAYDVSTNQPVRLDKPVVTVITTPGSNVTGEVTFTVTDIGVAPPGFTVRGISWPTTVRFYPLDADPLATQTTWSAAESCNGRLSCTYRTSNTNLLGGWYMVGQNNLLLVLTGLCPAGPGACSATGSGGVAYIPDVGEPEPPRVQIAGTASGRTAKVVVGALDPEGQSMSLTLDFGDGSAEMPAVLGQVVTHTYPTIADYQITARVRTADGRTALRSASAGLVPPDPFFLGLSVVAPPNDGVPALGSGLVQGWPSGARARILTWTTGCPSDPTSTRAQNTASSSNWANIAGDGRIDVPFSFWSSETNAAVLLVEGYVPADGYDAQVTGWSRCISTFGTAAKSIGAVAAGATSIPVPSSTVPIGNVVQIGSGTGAERRVVTGHGSLIVAPLSNAHAAGTPVVNLGAPTPPYVEPGPPADPVLPGGGGGSGGGGGGGGSSSSELIAISPARLLETRQGSGATTIDGQNLGAGLRPAGSITEIQVTGRAGVPDNATAAVLNVTVTDPQGPGFATVYPCGTTPPTASNLNYATGTTIPNNVITKIGDGGKVCIFTLAPTHLIADLTGYHPATATYTPIVPARLLETRQGSGATTIDGQNLGAGLRPAGSITEIQVTGRAGVPDNATAAVLNVTVTDPQGPGFATVYPCGTTPPTASNLNYATGTTIPNNVITKIGDGGKVCIFTLAPTHLIADLTGYHPATATYTPIVPARLLETRQGSGATTIDGQNLGAGLRPAGSITEIQVTGRAGVPDNATAAVLNVTVTDPQGPGFATVYPCGTTPPTASNLNYATGTTIPNNVITKIGDGGKVCIFTLAPTHLIADLTGTF
jgi:hypothetical protein